MIGITLCVIFEYYSNLVLLTHDAAVQTIFLPSSLMYWIFVTKKRNETHFWIETISQRSFSQADNSFWSPWNQLNHLMCVCVLKNLMRWLIYAWIFRIFKFCKMKLQSRVKMNESVAPPSSSSSSTSSSIFSHKM